MKPPWRRRRREAVVRSTEEPPLEVYVSPAPYGALVSIAGELDLATVPSLREALSGERVTGAAAVVVDLTDVTFLDSLGLTVLIDLDRDVGARSARLAIACPEGAARLLFDVTGVAERLPLHWTREEAERAMGSP